MRTLYPSVMNANWNCTHDIEGGCSQQCLSCGHPCSLHEGPNFSCTHDGMKRCQCDKHAGRKPSKYSRPRVDAFAP